MAKGGKQTNKIVLALRRADDIAIFQRFFDKSTSGWRYRCTGTVSKSGKRFTDYTPFRGRNPGKVKSALARLDRLSGLLDGLSITAALPRAELSDEDRTALHFHADLLRFQAVNTLIVECHFAQPLPDPVEFHRFPPPYNLILALDLTAAAERALSRDMPAILRTASAPGFRDDGATNAAGTLRALADMLARKGDDAGQLRALTLSQSLAPNPAKAARIVTLLRASGETGKATRLLGQALLNWPRTPALLALRDEAAAPS